MVKAKDFKSTYVRTTRRVRYVAVVLVVVILFFSFNVIAQTQDEDNTVLNEITLSDKAELTLEKESLLSRELNVLVKQTSAYKNSNNQIAKAQDSYDRTVASSKGIDTVRVYLGKNPFTGDEMYYYYEDDARVMLTLQKEWMPEQSKLMLDIAEATKYITEKSLIFGGRELYLGLYSSYKNREIKQKLYEIEEKALKASELKYSMGYITEQDFKMAQYRCDKAKADLSGAKRGYENMVRSFNSFAGQSVDMSYKKILADGTKVMPLKSQEYYLLRALEQRNEIVVQKAQIELYKQMMGIYEFRDVHKRYTRIKESWQKAEDDYHEAVLKLEIEAFKVEKDIKAAYLEVLNAESELENAISQLENQKKQYQRYKQQYELGYITESVLEQLEVAVMGSQLSVDIAMMTYNTKVLKLDSAARTGPAYGS